MTATAAYRIVESPLTASTAAPMPASSSSNVVGGNWLWPPKVGTCSSHWSGRIALEADVDTIASTLVGSAHLLAAGRDDVPLEPDELHDVLRTASNNAIDRRPTREQPTAGLRGATDSTGEFGQ